MTENQIEQLRSSIEAGDLSTAQWLIIQLQGSDQIVVEMLSDVWELEVRLELKHHLAVRWEHSRWSAGTLFRMYMNGLFISLLYKALEANLRKADTSD